MDQIVGRLIEARQKSKLSLEDIHAKTKIPLHQLKYLESFEFDKIGPSVYVKGFIRRYAQVVGINPETLWEQEQESQPVLSAARSSGLSKQPMRFNFGPFLRVGAVLALVVIVGILIRAALLTYFEPSPPAPPDVPPQDEPAPDGDQQEPPVQEPEVSVDKVKGDDSEAIYIVRNTDALDIKIEFSGSCWTRVTADGEKIQETTYRKDQTDQFTTAKEYRFRFGAPLNVSVTANGIKVELPDIKKGFNLVVQLEQKTE